MKTPQTCIAYLAVIVFISECKLKRNLNDRNGQVVVMQEKAVWYLIGARYYDPEVAQWFSPDAAGQFSSPYTYGSNPVIMVDPDGNFIFIPMLIGSAINNYLVSLR